jgi:crotonobetainyl-CoA:carnitine CoA-transferase CaiB-like acyl-CoA transferase
MRRCARSIRRSSTARQVSAFLEEHLAQRSNAEWLASFDAADIPAGPVNSIDDLYDDPHLRAVGQFYEIDHPTEGRLTATRFPVNFSRSPLTLRRPVPNLGGHGAIGSASKDQ